MVCVEPKKLVFFGLRERIHHILFFEDVGRRNSLELLPGTRLITSQDVLVEFFKSLKYGNYDFSFDLYKYKVPKMDSLVYEKPDLAFSLDRRSVFVFLNLIINNEFAVNRWTNEEKNEVITMWEDGFAGY